MIYAMRDYLDVKEHIRAVEAQRRKTRRTVLAWTFVIAFLVAYFGFGVMRADATPLCRVALSRLTIETDQLKPNEWQLIFKQDGIPAGVYKYKLDGNSAEVSTFTLEGHRGQGYSKLFAREMLRREPEIREVTGTLVMDNLAATGLVWIKREITEDECVRAIQNTPFVKTFAGLGFTVSDCYFRLRTKYLRVGMRR